MRLQQHQHVAKGVRMAPVLKCQLLNEALSCLCTTQYVPYTLDMYSYKPGMYTMAAAAKATAIFCRHPKEFEKKN